MFVEGKEYTPCCTPFEEAFHMNYWMKNIKNLAIVRFVELRFYDCS